MSTAGAERWSPAWGKVAGFVTSARAKLESHCLYLILRIYEGGSEVQKLIIARETLKVS